MTHHESATTYRPQLTLPRQAHTAEGPHDQTGMYVMHHALRRDFSATWASEGAPSRIPLGGCGCGCSGRARWR